MKCLVVIDMQNDFITGVLGTKEAQHILPKVIKKVKYYDGYVYYTQDTHSAEDYFESEEGKKLPRLHCVKNTKGWELPKKLYEAIFMKQHDWVLKSTFGSEALGYKLRELHLLAAHGIEEIELIGVCTNMCVISNALLLKAFLPGVRIKVDASCCAGTSPEAHQRALKVMSDCHIDIINGNICNECNYYIYDTKVSENCTPFDPYCYFRNRKNPDPNSVACSEFSPRVGNGGSIYKYENHD